MARNEIQEITAKAVAAKDELEMLRIGSDPSTPIVPVKRGDRAVVLKVEGGLAEVKMSDGLARDRTGWLTVEQADAGSSSSP